MLVLGRKSLQLLILSLISNSRALSFLLLKAGTPIRRDSVFKNADKLLLMHKTWNILS